MEENLNLVQVTLSVPDYLLLFYEKIGNQAGGISAEKVMEDALFKLAGELSLNAIYSRKKQGGIKGPGKCL